MQIRVERNLTERFPDKESQILQLEAADSDFHDLCRDYEECARVLQRLSKDPLADPQVLGEYQDIKIALEAEALDFIKVLP